MARIVVALSLLMLAAAASAGRTIEIVEHGIETALADLTLPSGGSGNVIVARSCEGCEPRVVLATTETRYFAQSTPVSYAEFERAVERARTAAAAASTLLGVYYDPDSGQVTRIELFGSRD